MYPMLFRAGLRDTCMRDVANLSESVKIHSPAARATSHVHRSRYPAWKTIWYLFYKITTVKQ
jgi:hypothetical protein